jgi:dipeptidyl aminopeptidase/acylaminoacyl peptidase
LTGQAAGTGCFRRAVNGVVAAFRDDVSTVRIGGVTLVLVALVLGAAAVARPAARPGGTIAFGSRDSIGFVSATGRYLGGFGTADEGPPAWSPDSGRIAYSLIHYQPRGGWDIWVMNANGSARHRLTAHGRDPAWSPDGSRIAFVRNRQVWVMNADGTAQRLLARHASTPSWSPDGALIVFVSGGFFDNHDEIAVMTADGTGRKRLTDNNVADENPDWSPDGTTIAFERVRVPANSDADLHSHLILMNADGTNKRGLMKSEGQDPSWSPDGSKLVYVVGTGSYLYVVNADGSGAHRLFPAPSAGLCDCFGPAWSRE